MQITAEGKLSLCLGLLALAGAGAMMVAPDKLWIGWSLVALAGVGGIGLGFHHFGRKFAAIFLVVGVLWFDYWYYSNVLGSNTAAKIEIEQHVVRSASSVPPAPRQLQSTAGKMLLSCAVPRGDKKNQEEARRNF